ncbi:MAG TPA: hypothetical protein VNJ08_12855 [Bacteriovoracaceae bacterium]|nr:hypothetical protein [Bacteriovoracaceae bacterium]
MNIFTNNLLDWGILVVLLGAAFYTLKAVGQEKSSFREDSYLVEFGRLSLMIPNWWTITEQSQNELKFERTDTRYDWYARFRYIPDSEMKPLPKLLEEKLNLEEIEFDQDVVFETDSRVLFRDDKIQEHFQEVIRVEGKAAQKVVERIYYDIYLMRGLNDEGYFIFESMSSVLNGLVEGPYFEESLSELSLKET